jgi:nitrogenase molybdenum-iron protein beta chain
VGAQETSAFLREVGIYAGIPQQVTEGVIRKEESRFYKYFISVSDFLGEYRNNLPWELYTVADSAYATGLSNFLVNELGYIPKGVYIIDSPAESFFTRISEILISRENKFKDLIYFETDGGFIQQDIRKKLGKSRRALFLGSGWEKFLAQETKNLYTFASLPIPEAVIINQSYVGYNGGLNLIEEIYSNVFKTKITSSRTLATEEIQERTPCPIK